MNRIKALRKQKGITVKDLADQLGIAQSMLTNYENGGTMPRNADFWRDLADFFDVSVGYLMGVSNSLGETRNGFDPDDAVRLAFIAFKRESVQEVISKPVEIEIDTPERYALFFNIDQLPDSEIAELSEHVRKIYQKKYKGKLTEFRVSDESAE